MTCMIPWQRGQAAKQGSTGLPAQRQLPSDSHGILQRHRRGRTAAAPLPTAHQHYRRMPKTPEAGIDT
jgi:hypothetical protein